MSLLGYKHCLLAEGMWGREASPWQLQVAPILYLGSWPLDLRK